MTSPDLDQAAETVLSFDGTPLAARRMGQGDKTPLLVVNAVGATLSAWRRALVDLVRERSIIMWDHRGLHESGPPVSDRIDPGAQAEDAIAVLDHFGIDQVAAVSWSNGGRIALELAHRYPDRLTGLVLVSGGYANTFGRILRLEPAPLLPPLAGVIKHFSSFIEGPIRGVVQRPEIAGLIRQSGLVGATADTAALVDLIRDMAACDMKTLLATFEAVAGDADPGLLRGVHVPALVIVGQKDPFMPRALAEEVARALPSSRLEIYERATHYLPIEYPARLSDDMRRFLLEANI